ncbi:MAG: hypothetical protein JHD07_00755 [Bradyrhizobium sp.]|jgi:MOSC domain-containing protein YiiM|uniref:MOSC domain-containing protein n=1 Tax=Bradyrhizobium sp. TaxID=376 RepID=UPI001A2A2079|nr:hypothetical protein [Bradyrhizobium sp.]MBJ7401904.1 hypothetical protein [Bradyrhizobium sp.]
MQSVPAGAADIPLGDSRPRAEGRNLRENVVLDFDALYDLPPGTVVRIGDALVRLTFHCEPCKRIANLVDLKSILHRRGVFRTFLNSGCIHVGDSSAVTEHKLQAISYAIGEHIH